MMRCVSIILVVFSWFSVSISSAQDSHWQYLDFPISFNPTFYSTFSLNRLKSYEDTTASVVYLYNTFQVGEWISITGQYCYYDIARFDGENYASIGSFGGPIYKVTKFQGNLYACGGFSCADSNTNVDYLAQYNGESWNSIGEFDNSVSAMAADSNYLYVAGIFTQINNQPFDGIARFDGTSWEALPAGGFYPNSSIRTLCIYQGELYVGGILNIPGELESERGLRVMRNDQWKKIPGDQFIDNSTIRDLVIYKDKLYILGDFFHLDNYLHSGVLVWDGQSVTAPYPDFIYHGLYGQSTLPTSPDMLVATSDYLYAGGTFGSIGGLEVKNLAAYDGEHWCSMYTEGLQVGILGMFSFRDTLYAHLYLNPYSNTLYPTGLYKWLGGDDFESCGTPTGVNAVQPDGVQVFPNPTRTTTTIKGDFSQNATYSLYDLIGTRVIQKSTGTAGEFQIDCSFLSPGIYLLKVNDGDRNFTCKILKK